MEQWSILSNRLNYVQYDRNPKTSYYLGVKAIDQKSHGKMYNRLKDEDRQILELDFCVNPDQLRGEYLDIYEGVQLEVLSDGKWMEIQI